MFIFSHTARHIPMARVIWLAPRAGVPRKEADQ
jgi:hypothetical protein